MRASVSAGAAALALVVPGSAGGEPAAPAFRSTVESISVVLRAQMSSWHRGCPVGIGSLRLVTLTYWGFDGRVHQGHLVVGHRYAPAVIGAMRAVFEARFPIRRMRPIDVYGASDHRSMAADNTSAFNCRRVAGSNSWSEHAYGRAIDINPRENPSVENGRVSPPGGAPYADRSRRAKGMIHAGDVVVRAFAAQGWGWGGNWRSPKDYQHFAASRH